MVAGNDRAVGDLHDERRVVFAAIGIDQEPREAAEHGGHAEPLRQPAGQALDPYVVGDVAAEGFLGQAEPAVFVGKAVHRMVGKQHHAAVIVTGYDFECREVLHG